MNLEPSQRGFSSHHRGSVTSSPLPTQRSGGHASRHINVDDSWVLFDNASPHEADIPATQRNARAKSAFEGVNDEDEHDILSSSYSVSATGSAGSALGEEFDDDLIDSFEEVALQLSFPNHNGRGSFTRPADLASTFAPTPSVPPVLGTKLAPSAPASSTAKQDLQTRIENWKNFETDDHKTKDDSLTRAGRALDVTDETAATWNMDEELEAHHHACLSTSVCPPPPLVHKRLYGDDVFRASTPSEVIRIKRLAQDFATSLSRGSREGGATAVHRRANRRLLFPQALPLVAPRITYSAFLKQHYQSHSTGLHQSYLNQFYAPCLGSILGGGLASPLECGIEARDAPFWSRGTYGSGGGFGSFSSSISTTTASTDHYGYY